MNPQYYSSPVSQKSSGFDKKIIFAVIGGFFLIIIGVVLLSFSGGADPKEQLARAVARQESLYQLTKNAEKNIRSGDLKKINSDASLFLTSDLSTLRSLMQSSGNKNVPKDISASEYDAKAEERLTEAALNGRYDDTYITIMSQKIDSQQALLREISGKSNNPATKQGVTIVYNKLENIQKQLGDLQ